MMRFRPLPGGRSPYLTDNSSIYLNIADLSFNITKYSKLVVKAIGTKYCSHIANGKIVDADLDEYQQYKRKCPSFSHDALVSLALHSSVARQLPSEDCFIFHSAAISYRERGVLFAAPSGTGKTTHISLWKKNLGNDVSIINGDKPIIRINQWEGSGGCAMAYGSPWAGKEGWQTNAKVVVDSIVFIDRGDRNTIEQVSPDRVLERAMRQTYFPPSGVAKVQTLELLGKLLSSVRLFILSCDMTDGAFKASYEGLFGPLLEG